MGEMEVLYARATYGEEEKKAVNDVLDDPKNLAGGGYTEKFQEEVSDLFSKEYGIMVNSGSSALLLAIEALDLEEGAEVITPLVTFSTTIAPIVQKNLVPVFVDVGVGDYLLNIDEVKDAITDKTEAIMVPSLLGNVPNFPRLKRIAEDHDIYLIEDSADTLGAKIQEERTGKFTHISATSFYASHVITAFGGGGMICVNNEEWMKRIKKLRSWGRASAVDETEDINKRLEGDLKGVNYDSKFIFDELGYNLQTIEASPAFGLEQLKKLDEFSKQRRKNFKEFKNFFSEYPDYFILPEQREDVETSWLGFPLTLKDDSPFERKEIVKFLEKNNIQTRSLWSGNLLKHPGFEDIDHRKVKEKYENANKIMKDSFVIGCHQSIDGEKREYVKSKFREFIEKHE